MERLEDWIQGSQEERWKMRLKNNEICADSEETYFFYPQAFLNTRDNIVAMGFCDLCLAFKPTLV